MLYVHLMSISVRVHRESWRAERSMTSHNHVCRSCAACGFWVDFQELGIRGFIKVWFAIHNFTTACSCIRASEFSFYCPEFPMCLKCMHVSNQCRICVDYAAIVLAKKAEQCSSPLDAPVLSHCSRDDSCTGQPCVGLAMRCHGATGASLDH